MSHSLEALLAWLAAADPVVSGHTETVRCEGGQTRHQEPVQGGYDMIC